MNSSSIIRYTSVTVIVLILAALGFWYFFIQAKQEKIARENAGRGTEVTAPSFGSVVGSTYENIISSLSTLVGGGNSRTSEILPRLSQVGRTPTAGLGFVEVDLSSTPTQAGQTGSSTQLRFVERSTGYIFDVDPETGILQRLTNTLVPHIYEAIVTRKGVVMRGLDETNTITTALGTISASSSPSGNTGVLVQKPLPSGIRSIITSPDGAVLLYIVRDTDGAFAGMRSLWDNAKPQRLFSSNLSGWRMHPASNGRVVIAQWPSDSVAGSAYVVGNDGALLPLIRDVPGLTVLPHSSSEALLYGESRGNLTLFARTDQNSTSVALPIRTTAEKCAWVPGKKLVAYCAVPQGVPPSNFLDSWHRGETHTADAWWRVDAAAGSAELLFSPAGLELDVESPAIDTDGNYIAFINARDKTLWLLRIKE